MAVSLPKCRLFSGKVNATKGTVNRVPIGHFISRKELKGINVLVDVENPMTIKCFKPGRDAFNGFQALDIKYES